MYIDGLMPSIRPLVARYREEGQRSQRGDRERPPFLDVVQCATDEGEAYRARVRNTTIADIGNKKTVRLMAGRPVKAERRVGELDPKSRVMLVESSTGSSLSREAIRDPDGDGLALLDEGQGSYDPSSTPTSVPSNSEYPHADGDSELFAFRASRVTPAPRIPGEEHAPHVRNTRPGWRELPPRNSKREALVCHKCYSSGHIAPDCALQPSFAEVERIIRNYGRLTPEEKQRVPAESYWKARGLDEVIQAHAQELQQRGKISATQTPPGDLPAVPDLGN